jgi:dienelactone hydrolase
MFRVAHIAMILAFAAIVQRSSAGEESHFVKATVGSDFSYKMELDSEHDSFRVFRLTYPSPVESPVKQNNTIPAELYLPKNFKPGSSPRPAVICLHILGGGFELVKLQCTVLASRGIPAMWFKLPYYAERGLPGGTKALAANPRLFAAAVEQGVQDVRRAVDLLASRPDVNPKQIGVTGISLGGILAGTAAAEEPRINRTVLLLAGGDMMPVVHHAREARLMSETLAKLPPEERAEVEQAIRRGDPLEHAPLLRERAMHGRVLMMNAGEDEVIPRVCTEKLAEALGIRDRVVWLDGLGHYTAISALPKLLKTTVDFFAQDMPADAVAAESPQVVAKSPTPRQQFVECLKQVQTLLMSEPAAGHCHLADLEVDITQADGKKIVGQVRVIHGHNCKSGPPQFSIRVNIDGLLHLAAGQGDGRSSGPWMASDKVVFHGALLRNEAHANPLSLVNQEYLKHLKIVEGLVAAVAMAPEIIDQWVTVSDFPIEKLNILTVQRRGGSERVHLYSDADHNPEHLEFDIQGITGTIKFHAWQLNAPSQEQLYEEPQNLPVKQVPAADLVKMWAAVFDFAGETIQPPSMPPVGKQPLKIVARDPAGHGLVCEAQGKRVLIVGGTPEQMGAAQGQLLRETILRLTERVVYGMGAADSMNSGQWWFDRTAEIERRTVPHMPPRFLAECDAMAHAAGVSTRDARAANLFPERFHCSGVALCGKATADGRILHARVLDYMRDIGLQTSACVTVFAPAGRHAWISAGYAGFLGTVTAMNECGLAVGEMGGRGEGNWDGVPMTFLLRDIMERAATVDDALKILRESPRTCEYYYVFSDKSRAMAAVHCDPKQVTVLRPGEQHPLLPHVPEDTVLVSGDRRAKALSERIEQSYGHIDVARLEEIIKRPVAMNSNLHDAIFSPETLELYIADAGRTTPACDEPYAKFGLTELLEFYRQNK